MLNLPNDYDKIFIVCYPRGAGGNFLIQCLSLADDCVFSNKKLAKKQLDGQFDLQAKIDYLDRALSDCKTAGYWTDLGFTNHLMYGIRIADTRTVFPEILSHRIDPIVSRVIAAKKKMFMLCHDILAIADLKILLPNANIIFFTEYREFVMSRSRYSDEHRFQTKLYVYWQSVRQDDWPVSPPTTMSQLQELPVAIQDRLIKELDSEITQWFDLNEEFDTCWHEMAERLHQRWPEHSLIWNVAKNYQDFDHLRSACDTVRHKFDIAPVPLAVLDWFYHQWQDTININKVEITRYFACH
jgi:hypothetical protein